MGQNSVSRVRLHKGTWHRGKRLPCVRPYCTRCLGPKILAGACQQPFYCSESPNRAAQARRGRELPKVARNGSGQSPGCVRTGSGRRPTDRVQRGYPRLPPERGYPCLPPDNCQLPTNSRQPPAMSCAICICMGMSFWAATCVAFWHQAPRCTQPCSGTTATAHFCAQMWLLRGLEVLAQNC